MTCEEEMFMFEVVEKETIFNLFGNEITATLYTQNKNNYHNYYQSKNKHSNSLVKQKNKKHRLKKYIWNLLLGIRKLRNPKIKVWFMKLIVNADWFGTHSWYDMLYKHPQCA